MKLLLSPHCDDEALFASYVCLREQPCVVVCFNGRRARHLAPDSEREAETTEAMRILGCDAEFMRVQSDPADWDLLLERLGAFTDVDEVWAPLVEEDGSDGHNGVTRIAEELWPGKISYYATYTGKGEKSQVGEQVNATPEEQELKRRALSCYRSQIARPATSHNFEQGLDEYLTEPPSSSDWRRLHHAAIERDLQPLKLNLGAGARPLDGFTNLDKKTGWLFEEGLAYDDESVDAITVSHALMYVEEDNWDDVFVEIARVLAPGGIVRITEDDMEHPDSRSYQGARPGKKRTTGVTLTGPRLVSEHLLFADLTPVPVEPGETLWHDDSLIQANHGDPPDVFHMEAKK